MCPIRASVCRLLTCGRATFTSSGQIYRTIFYQSQDPNSSLLGSPGSQHSLCITVTPLLFLLTVHLGWHEQHFSCQTAIWWCLGHGTRRSELWDAVTGAARRGLSTSVAFSQDGSHVMSAQWRHSADLEIWNTASGLACKATTLTKRLLLKTFN